MRRDALAEAELTLGAALARHDLTAPAAARQAATGIIAAQVDALGWLPENDREISGPDADTAPVSFALQDVTGMLGVSDAPPTCTLAEAQAATGCFLDILDASPDNGGLTIALKDIFRFDDHHPSAGLSQPQDRLGLACSPLIPRLRQAGGQIVATTKLSAWCYLPLEFNERVTPPRHPVAADLLVGGSSSGAAVAVASRAVSVALGSDTGGSTRIPAALTGIYGFKPSMGAIHTQGTVPLGKTQDTVGILARSAKDLQSVFSVLTSLPRPQKAKASPRLIALPEDAFSRADATVREARDRLLHQLAGLDIGIRHTGKIALDQLNAAAGLITGFEAARFHAPRMAQFASDYPETVRTRLLAGMAVSQRAYQAASHLRRSSLPQIIRTVFDNCDFVLFPVVNRHAFLRPEEWRDLVPGEIGALSLELLSMNRWVNLLGLPAISVPVEIAGKTLAAVQIVGRPGSDHHLLTLVRDLERFRLSLKRTGVPKLCMMRSEIHTGEGGQHGWSHPGQTIFGNVMSQRCNRVRNAVALPRSSGLRRQVW